MDRLRRSLRESFRRKKDHVPESSKPHQWQSDEIAVRSGTCVFPVKYLGCVEVFESRGMQVCEEALKVLRNSRRRPIKGTLFVTGDGLRVVDDETKGLIVDQTIEKVSFCAPDRSHERGFSYICRDGTTRRWMCHGFHANKDSGERLSHAVGCAFAVCLERKQKRDKEAVTMNFDPKTSSFVRTGSFRQTSITERLQDPQVAKPSEPPPVKPVHNPYAVERPHATPNLLQRQGSLRGGPLNTASPFKRQLSLRINDLPSNMERQRSHSVDVTLSSFQKANTNASAIPETSPNDQTDTITSMCQQLARGLRMLSSVDDPFYNVDDDCKNDNKNQQTNNTQSALSFNDQLKNKINTSNVFPSDSINWTEIKSISTTTNTTMNNQNTNTNTNSHPKLQLGNKSNSIMTSSAVPIAAPRYNNPNFSQLRSQSLGSADAFFESKSNINTSVNWPNSQQNNDANLPIDQSSVWTNGSSAYQTNNACPVTTAPTIPAPSDPFDSEWVALASRHHQDNFRSTNPFTQSSAPVKAFEVHM